MCPVPTSQVRGLRPDSKRFPGCREGRRQHLNRAQVLHPALSAGHPALHTLPCTPHGFISRSPHDSRMM